MTAAGFWCERQPPTLEELRADMAAKHARGETWQNVTADPPLDPYRPGVRGTIAGRAVALIVTPDGERFTLPVVRAMWRGPRNTAWCDAESEAEALEALAAVRARWGCTEGEPERYPGEPSPLARH